MFPNRRISFLSRKNWSRTLSVTNEQFNDAVKHLKSLTKEPDNQTKLQIYALFKQAKEGPSPKSFSFSLDPITHAKTNAWSKLGEMKKEDAMEQYVGLVSKLLGAESNKVGGEATASEISSHQDTTKYSVEYVAFPRRHSSPIDTEFIQVDSAVPSGVVTVKLNRPQTLNAFNMKMWHELRSVFQNLGTQARVCILSSTSQKSFSTGMDLGVFMEMQQVLDKEGCEGRQREALSHLIAFLQDAISAPEKAEVPVIAAISGHCIGGAVDLITACDIRYCTADAQFSIKETDLAMVADIGTLQRLPKLIGDQQARELAYTGRVVTGKEAAALGIVLKCFDTYEEMMEHVHATAAAIAAKSPLTIRGIKKTILFTRDHTVSESLQQVSMHNSAQLYSEDLKTAMMAAMKRTNPTFKV